MDDIFDRIRDQLPLIAAHLREGGGESGLCRKLGVKRAELRRCRRLHPELEELWRANRCEVAERVEAALLRRATGYEEDNGKQVPPDVRAAVFWLKNRRPERWNETGRKNADNPEIRLAPEEENL